MRCKSRPAGAGAPAALDHRSVLDFGAGCAIEGIAAALANAGLNGVKLETTAEDLIGRPLDFDLVLAGDVFYDKALAARALDWLRALDVPVLIGDPSRGFLDLGGLRKLASYRASWDGDTRCEILRDTTVFALIC